MNRLMNSTRTAFLLLLAGSLLALPIVGCAAGGTASQEDAKGGGAAASYTKPAPDALKEKLTPLQWHVTQESGTEPAFNNEYWDNHEPGLYVDVVSGEPLHRDVCLNARQRAIGMTPCVSWARGPLLELDL